MLAARYTLGIANDLGGDRGGSISMVGKNREGEDGPIDVGRVRMVELTLVLGEVGLLETWNTVSVSMLSRVLSGVLHAGFLLDSLCDARPINGSVAITELACEGIETVSEVLGDLAGNLVEDMFSKWDSREETGFYSL